MIFKEFMNSSEGWHLFLNVFHNLHDKDNVLIYCDWLEDNNFPKTSEYIRKLISSPNFYTEFSPVSDELKQHDIVVSTDDGATLTYKDKKYKITYSAIQKYNEKTKKWIKASENLAEIAPGLLVCLFFNYFRVYDNNHNNVIYNGFFQQHESELRSIYNEIEIYRPLNQNIATKLFWKIREVRKFLRNIPKTVKIHNLFLTGLAGQIHDIEELLRRSNNVGQRLFTELNSLYPLINKLRER